MTAAFPQVKAGPYGKRFFSRRLRLCLLFLLLVPTTAFAWGNRPVNPSALIEVTAFGQNPGDLRMFKYVPPNLGASRPLVVALHGCTQQAEGYDDETGWIKLADKHGFALLLPQEKIHQAKCFRWFESGHIQRDQGEALSIRQMVEKMKTDHQVHPQRIYITGLSAGGGMTAVMLAAYPDVFAGGAIVAGIPYRCATTESEAQQKCGLFGRAPAPEKDLTPMQWGDMVRAASSHTGPFPRVSIWHGSSDFIVHQKNMMELMEQWTNVHGLNQTPAIDETVNGHAHKVFKDQNGNALVETFLVNGMGHGTPVDPGTGDAQCGRAAPFILSAGICSSFHIVRFWGLDQP
jgi:poly(hydroxyalkanoate) depolymerase family esterase